MITLWFIAITDWLKRKLRRCAHDGCWRAGEPCRLAPYDSEPNEWFCIDHMYRAGYCEGCGVFNAGIDSFDFNNPAGLCQHCRHMLEAESGAFDEDDPNYFEFGP